MNIKMTIEYDGSGFCGWQRQNNQRTVQGEVEKLLKKFFNQPITIDGSGRTDSGVHSMGQVATFKSNGSFAPEKLKLIMNRLLPKDIFIKELDEVDLDFHGRYSAKKKKYIYKIDRSEDRSVFTRKHYCHYTKPLNLEAMKEATKFFIGEHDFTAFRAKGSGNINPVREVYEINFQEEGNFLEIEFIGNGFLYKMVRIMVATLLDVGTGKLEPADIADIIISKDRDRAKKTAPPEGLYLAEVYY